MFRAVNLAKEINRYANRYLRMMTPAAPSEAIVPRVSIVPFDFPQATVNKACAASSTRHVTAASSSPAQRWPIRTGSLMSRLPTTAVVPTTGIYIYKRFMSKHTDYADYERPRWERKTQVNNWIEPKRKRLDQNYYQQKNQQRDSDQTDYSQTQQVSEEYHDPYYDYFYPRLDDIYYKVSDPRKRVYQQTWCEFPMEPVKKQRPPWLDENYRAPVQQRSPQDRLPKTARPTLIDMNECCNSPPVSPIHPACRSARFSSKNREIIERRRNYATTLPPDPRYINNKQPRVRIQSRTAKNDKCMSLDSMYDIWTYIRQRASRIS